MAKQSLIQATGRRKTAVATINLKPGKGDIKVNGKPLDEYFTTASQRTEAMQALFYLERHKEFDIQVRAHGGGLGGQAGATSLAISRALIEFDPETRSSLKSRGYLRRDPRMRERKKSGQPGARKRFQFSKR